MMRLGIRAAIVVAALFASCVSGLRAADEDTTKEFYSLASVVSQKGPAGPPPPQPAFNASDYDRYRHGGNGVLIGAPYVKTSDGRIFGCLQGLEATLYPDTPYTRWMLDAYFYRVAQTGYWVDAGTLVNAPSFLHNFTPDSILKYGGCNDNGGFEATGLAPGKYLATVDVRVPMMRSYLDPDQALFMTPSGEPGIVYSSKIVHASYYADGWELFGGTYIIPADGAPQQTNESSWYVVAHLHVGSPTTGHSKK